MENILASYLLATGENPQAGNQPSWAKQLLAVIECGGKPGTPRSKKRYEDKIVATLTIGRGSAIRDCKRAWKKVELACQEHPIATSTHQEGEQPCLPSLEPCPFGRGGCQN